MSRKQSINWFSPELGSLEIEYVNDVIASNYINDGKVTNELEDKIAEFLNVKYCVAVTSGTAALTLSLLALGIGPGDEVIVPDLTFIATANAVTMTGAAVTLVDIEPDRFTIDLDRVVEAISPKSKAIIAVDVNGRGADYLALQKLCDEHGLFLICDSAEALGSKYNGQYLGTFGKAGCFSFSANKTITTGQGGMVATNDEALYYRLRELKDQGRRYQGTGGDDLHPVMGYNFKFTNVQAAIGLAQFTKIHERLKFFKQRDEFYLKTLRNHKKISFPDNNNRNREEVHQWTDILSPHRDMIKATLLANNIQSRAFWLPLHQQQPYKQADSLFPNSIYASQQGLWLPSSFNLTREQAQLVCDVIQDL